MGATALIAGTALSAGAKIYGGAQQDAAMHAAAGQLDTESGQAVAAGIQGAIAARRRGKYVASNARGFTAASGLTTTGTSAIANEGQIRGQAEYDALAAIYSGDSRAQALQFRAANMRAEGSAARTAGWLSGTATILSGARSWYDKYGASA